jgi:uncharacterized membrane protein
MALFGRTISHYFSEEERNSIHAAIKVAEDNTSGEIRIYIESRNPLMSPLKRAEEIFYKWQMDRTVNHNGILIYIAYKDREFAIFGDFGCIKNFPNNFWKDEAKRLSYNFYHKNKLQGLLNLINTLHDQFIIYYPNKGEPKNELPDEIIFGK